MNGLAWRPADCDVGVVCGACGATYPVADGIPVILPGEIADWGRMQRDLYDAVAPHYDDAIPALYAAAAREFARVLTRDLHSRVIALTTRAPELVRAMADAGFASTEVTTLGLNGQRPSVVKFMRG